MLKLTRRVRDTLWRLLKSTCISLSAIPHRSPPLTIFITPPLPQPQINAVIFTGTIFYSFLFQHWKWRGEVCGRQYFREETILLSFQSSQLLLSLVVALKEVSKHTQKISVKEEQVEGNISKWPKIEHVSILHRNCMWLWFSLQLKMNHSKICTFFDTPRKRVCFTNMKVTGCRLVCLH